MNLECNDISMLSNRELSVDDLYKLSEKITKSDEESDTAFTKPNQPQSIILRIRKNIGFSLVNVAYGILLIHMLYLLGKLISENIWVNSSSISTNMFYYIFWLYFPIPVCIWSTYYKWWRFKVQKLAGIITVISNIALTLACIMHMIIDIFFIPLLGLFPLSRDITKGMIVSLSQFILFLPSFIIMAVFIKIFVQMIIDPNTINYIMHFRVDRNLDLRRGKKFAYDMKIFRKVLNGKSYAVKEPDRPLHSLFEGATGSGKTSMCFTVAIANDLDQKGYNSDYAKKFVLSNLENNNLRLNKQFEDKDFTLNYVDSNNPHSKIGRKLKYLKKYCKNCGLTVVAPNAAFADEIYSLAKARGFTKIRRIDPMLDPLTGKNKDDFIGLNPLYIDPSVKGFSRKLEIVQKARNFADVLQAINEMGGNSNVYFSSLNHQTISSISVLLMKVYPELYPGKQPTPQTFQAILNDFSKVSNYIAYLENDCEDSSEYQYIIDFVKSDLLGDGAKNFKEQARGLSIIINELLSNPLIRDILCCEQSVDIDKALRDGEIIIVNFALELGSTDSTTLGLFFLLNFKSAVFRRPLATRIPNFVYIDEFVCLLHPELIAAFTLFRQYAVSMHISIQSQAQFDQSNDTRFMKNVILVNTATQVLYGRTGLEEMETYEKLAGKVDAVSEQQTISENSITTDDPTLSYSTRSSMQKVNAVEGIDIRMQDFSYCHVVTVDQGNPVAMFKATTDFLSFERRNAKIRRIQVDWSKYYQSEDKAEAESSHQQYGGYQVNTKNTGSIILDSDIKDNTIDLSARQATILLQRNKQNESISAATQPIDSLDFITVSKNTLKIDNILNNSIPIAPDDYKEEQTLVKDPTIDYENKIKVNKDGKASIDFDL